MATLPFAHGLCSPRQSCALLKWALLGGSARAFVAYARCCPVPMYSAHTHHWVLLGSVICGVPGGQCGRAEVHWPILQQDPVWSSQPHARGAEHFSASTSICRQSAAHAPACTLATPEPSALGAQQAPNADAPMAHTSPCMPPPPSHSPTLPLPGAQG